MTVWMYTKNYATDVIQKKWDVNNANYFSSITVVCECMCVKALGL